MDFLEHLLTFLEKKEANELIQSLSLKQKSSFQVNTLKIDSNQEEMLFKNFTQHSFVKHGYLFNKEEVLLGKSILFEAGAYYIQEPAAMLAVELLNPKPNEKVLDMCAAPGGKSFHAINRMHDQGLLVCNDIHPIRAQILSSNLEKCGCKQILVLNDSSTNYKKYFHHYFDKIILDAPCSGSGMFRKNDFAKEDWSIQKVYECQRIQKELLEDAYQMLTGQGSILYSTCSFSIQENEEVVIDFLNHHPDCYLEQIPLQKEYFPSIGITGAIRLHPNHYDGEGHFIAIIKKDSSTPCIKPMLRKKEKMIHPSVCDFLDSIQFEYHKKNIINLNEHYYYADFDHFALDHVKFLRYGLCLGEVSNNRFIPSHSLAMYPFNNKHYIELNLKEAIQFLEGNCISKEGNEKFKIVTYYGLPLGWSKQVNNILKNHYPKGLRKKLSEEYEYFNSNLKN